MTTPADQDDMKDAKLKDKIEKAKSELTFLNKVKRAIYKVEENKKDKEEADSLDNIEKQISES